MSRVLPLLCLLAAVALAGVGLFQWLNPPQPAVLSKPDEVCDLGKVGPGEHEFVIRFHNTGGSPGRIIGFQASCARNCCFGPRDSDQLVVPPGETVECRGVVEVKEPGAFEGPVELFYHDTDIHQVTITVKGVCVAEGTNAPPKQ